MGAVGGVLLPVLKSVHGASELALSSVTSSTGPRPTYPFCLRVYHLLVCIEKMFLDKGIHTSWGTIREKLSTHQAVTIVFPTDPEKVLRIRKGLTPEKEHKKIYDLLDVPYEIMKSQKWWSKE